MIKHTWIDYVLGLVAGTAIYIWATPPRPEAAVAAYAAVSAFASIVGGIGGVALGATHQGPRFERLEEKHPGVVRRVYSSTLLGALIGALLPVVGIWISDCRPHAAMVLTGVGLTTALVRIIRLLWVFDSLLRLEELDRRHEPLPPRKNAGPSTSVRTPVE